MTEKRAPTRPTRRTRRSQITWAALFALGLGAVFVWAMYFGLSLRTPPERCGVDLVARGPRCCAPGQSLDQNLACVGVPQSCPPGLKRSAEVSASTARAPLAAGCVAPKARVPFAAGEVLIGPSDWQSEATPARRVRVSGFALDAHEVTVRSWSDCALSGMCRKLAAHEPGLPVTGVSAAEAARYCTFEGGRLPTSDELIYASAGPKARRFPWGPTGLVCRRAAYGLVDGPCGEGARGPELAGSRPAGATPEGVFDLSGNVAEWALHEDGSTTLHGGSFRSKLAAELTSTSEMPARVGDDIGLRCAYDLTDTR